MKIKELIKKLSKMDGDKQIILSSDPEGNNYSPLNSILEEKIEEYTEEYKNCIILYP